LGGSSTTFAGNCQRDWRIGCARQDTPAFEGYLDHELIGNGDDPGHLLVVSRRGSREQADAVIGAYSSNPNSVAANALLEKPRRRFVDGLAVRR